MIIQSLLDTDLYKFTMQQAVFRKFPDVEVEYKFQCRNLDRGTLSKHIHRIRSEIGNLCTLKFNKLELKYLGELPFMSKGYINYLRNFKLNYDHISIFEYDRQLDIRIKGDWLSTILFETPVLAIISEIYSTDTCISTKEGIKRLNDKMIQLLEFQSVPIKHRFPTIVDRMEMPKLMISDFGTRRRYSRKWHDYVIKRLTGYIIGTSNVYLARKYKIKPIGTMAHEFIQAMQSLVRLEDSQKYAFQTWADVYRGDLGIALSDTLGMDAFFRDFDKYFAKLFDGARQDSGDPFLWCNKLIEHYAKLGINPKTKKAIFSDGLTFKKAMDLYAEFYRRIDCSFGIGTYLTNDMGFVAPQLVIKMIKCNGRPVAKISDSRGKQMCVDEKYLKYLRSVFKIPTPVIVKVDGLKTSG